jgi:hypothetical protein
LGSLLLPALLEASKMDSLGLLRVYEPNSD